MTLQDLIDQKKQNLTTELVTAIVRDIARSFFYLHARGLRVKNLSLSSVAVVGNDMIAKLIVTPTNIMNIMKDGDGPDDMAALSRLIDVLIVEVPA